ncbi:hypothetical protein PVAG01_03487 [Phlyctema vagabunda]|uniref:Cytochrome oxidase c assembly-domain-containing protein n=1 Tax=Phlyctema vagabunda TaxID=108571 RepID=A0ABR4PMQ8_9HELO
MPKSVTDATRFTSTTPHASARPPSAYTKPIPNASRLRTPGPTGETPQQKVARLRAAAAKTRDAKISTFDKVLVHGRVWADRAHRFTTLSLIGITFICGGVTVYALGDMMIYNRKKRAEFYAQEKATRENAIEKAKLAISHGTASQDDIEFIEREETYRQYMEERINKPGLWKRSTQWLFSSLKKDDEISGESSTKKASGDATAGSAEGSVLKALEDKKNVAEGKITQAISAEKNRQRTGGPLDRLGSSDDENTPKAGGWTSFMNVKR